MKKINKIRLISDCYALGMHDAKQEFEPIIERLKHEAEVEENKFADERKKWEDERKILVDRINDLTTNQWRIIEGVLEKVAPEKYESIQKELTEQVRKDFQ